MSPLVLIAVVQNVGNAIGDERFPSSNISFDPVENDSGVRPVCNGDGTWYWVDSECRCAIVTSFRTNFAVMRIGAINPKGSKSPAMLERISL